MSITWLHREGVDDIEALLPNSVAAMTFPEGSFDVFVHGEAAEVRAVVNTCSQSEASPRTVHQSRRIGAAPTPTRPGGRLSATGSLTRPTTSDTAIPANAGRPLGRPMKDRTAFNETLTSVEDLDNLYCAPSQGVKDKETERLDLGCRDFIAMSPFVLVGTVNEGDLDVSPRGGRPRQGARRVPARNSRPATTASIRSATSSLTAESVSARPCGLTVAHVSPPTT